LSCSNYTTHLAGASRSNTLRYKTGVESTCNGGVS